MTGYYDCCEHCDLTDAVTHPRELKRDRHVGPCPKGCNGDATVTFREPGQ